MIDKDNQIGRILCYDDCETLEKCHDIPTYSEKEDAIKLINSRIKGKTNTIKFLKLCKAQLEKNPVPSDIEKCSVRTAVEHDHNNQKEPFAVVRETRFHVPVKRERLGNFATKDEAERFQMSAKLKEKEAKDE